jgi:hypothetical protein
MSTPERVLNQEADPIARLTALDMVEGARQDQWQVRKTRRKEQSFVCSWTTCGRVFGKYEHLQRHERSRTLHQPMPYA